ncbi:MAG: formylglycine-generating enzyme family protein [Acidobacteria bacterium]|nr:formylglycine-generating enzyme family protein [Acidobacteriota bacterium]
MSILSRKSKQYIRIFTSLILFISMFSFSACKNPKPVDNRMAAPLEKPLLKVESYFGIKVGDFLIPETIEIPSGKFIMGSDAAEEIPKEEQPKHSVSLSAFEMGRLEVTNAQYNEFIKATGYKNEKWQENLAPGTENFPATNISWKDAEAYCKWLSEVTKKNYRLPTEAEWEYAAGGAQGVEYSWGNPWKPKLACVGGEQKSTTYVGSFSPNAFGLYDTTGNVWEWCQDWYDPEFYQKSQENNPQNTVEGKSKVQRGGAWNSPEKYARIKFRSRNAIDSRVLTTGFRVIVTP